MKNIVFILLCVFSIHTNLHSQNNPLINSPSLSPDGKIMAFNYQGDIWTVSTSGENLNRLTIHNAYDTNPIWSTNGKLIAFQSNRYGNNDIFTIPSNGGTPTRITFHSADDKITDFTPENNIIFTTVRNFVQIEREPEIQSVSANGGTPFRILNALGFDAKLSPNKKFIAFTRGTCRIEREAYKGPANRDIWLYDIKNDKYNQLTTFKGQDLAPNWANNNTIYFQSARSGKYNIHKITIDNLGEKTGTISQLTFLKDMGLFSFNMSKNGRDIIFVSGDKVWLLDTTTKKITPIYITINSDYRFDPIERKTYTSDASEMVVSPNGKYRIMVIRGEIFITENDPDKSRSINISNSSYKDFNVSWLNNTTVIFISDRNGFNNIYTITSNDPTNKNLFTTLKRKITQITNNTEGNTNPVLSPNKKLIAYNQGYGKLIIASISEEGKINNEKMLLNGWDAPSNIAWSPDSKWVTYNLSDLYFNEEIYIHKADNSQKPVNISMHPKSDIGAIWSKDGSKIAFSSNRNNGDHDIWFVWLKKEDWEKTQQDWDEIAVENKDKKEEKKEGDKTKNNVEDITIDFENIYERQQQVTSYTGGEYLDAISKDGKTFYYTTGNSGRGNPDIESDLYQINWEGKEKKKLTSDNTRPESVSLNSEEDFIYYLSKGKSFRIKLANDKKENLPFKAVVKINYKEEANQIFEEAWLVINNRFYDPKHHGQDWHKLKNIYKPLALKASTRTDFKGIFNKMLGQINASHMGMYRGEKRESVQEETTGILGIEFTPKNKQLKVSNVIPNTASDREVSKLHEGDIITSVNGEKVSVSENIYKHLVNTANEKIILGVISNGKEKEIIIRPKSNSKTDNYKAWVKERKRLTEKYSNGRLGYIHIQGMNWTSFERFERELTAAGLGKEGIVIDVRYNGGGWTTDYLMAVLNVKQHAYTIPRGAAKDLKKEHRKFKNYYPYSERLPLAALTKPSIALCNQNSYSNAEIFSHAYKELKIGKLVGTPTFGAVISTGGQNLIDGSYIRVPFRGWYVKSSGKNMDFTPATPDIIINNNPDDRAKGKDSQLKKAVEELLKQL
ncbi:S41 family peptidase [Lutibacter sp.]